MDRLQHLKGDAGGSRDCTLDTTSPPSESFMTANESSKYYSLSDSESTFDISSLKEVDVTPTTSIQDNTITDTDDVISNLSPISNKPSNLETYKIGKQIEAANILSGGVNIFDDNDNSYDGNELVIDDNMMESDDKCTTDMKADDSELRDSEVLDTSLVGSESAVESKDTEVVLQIDGKNVDAIDIGNGLYLYRKEGQEELAAVQIIDDDQQQPSFKFLKVRENAEGNLEVYEEIEIEVPKEMPSKSEKITPKPSGLVPMKAINKVISETTSTKSLDQNKSKTPEKQELKPIISDKPQIEITNTAEQKFNLSQKMKNSEARKSPLSFTPMTYHSTPNKDGVPLTKVMVDLQLQPSRNSDNVKKTIEVHTDSCKLKTVDAQNKVIESSKELTESIQNATTETETPIAKPQTEKQILQPESKAQEPIVSVQLDTEKTVNISAGILETRDEKPVKETDSTPKEIITTSSETSAKTSMELKEVIDKKEYKSSCVNNLDSACVQDSKTIDVSIDTHKHINKNNNDSKTFTQVPVPQINNSTEKNDIPTSSKDIPKLESEMKPIIKESIHNLEEEISSQVKSDAKVKPPLVATVAHAPEKVNKIEKDIEVIDAKINNTDVTIDKPILSHIPIKMLQQEIKRPTMIPSIKSVPPVPLTVSKVETISAVPKQETDSKPGDKFNSPNQNSAKSSKVEKSHISETDKNNDNSSSLKDIIKNDVNLAQPSSNQLPNQQSSNKVVSSDKKEILPQVKPCESKVINNNTPVPFGKWTEVNRQAFLNKIKEAKVPATASSTQQLKQANDLNRRDVLKKIDSQRQSAVNAAAAKAQELSTKPVVKNETAFTSVKTIPQEKLPLKVEAGPTIKNKVQKTYSLKEKPQESTVTSSDSANTKSQSKEATKNQDIIDRTIEDMLNKPSAPPSKQDAKKNAKETGSKPAVEIVKGNHSELSTKNDQSDVLDAVEKKMNELHGIPFVERPAHELPILPTQVDVKSSKPEFNSRKSSSEKPHSVPALLPFSKKHQHKDIIDVDEDEIIEHEPITGDIKPNNVKQATTIKEKIKSDIRKSQITAKKDVVITEKDFDKFARRNSKTCEDQLTVNFGNKQQLNVHNIVEKGIPKARNQSYHNSYAPFTQKARNVDFYKSCPKSNVNNLPNSNNKNYNSTNTKLQHAYNVTMNAKMQKTSPITIIEDKPVKVVFMESSHEFVPNQLNVQGAQLSPEKKTPEAEALNLSSCDSLDSDLMDAIDGVRSLDNKNKTSKHQRKQVLTPVEAPELELIEPRDLGLHESPKRKRKLDHAKQEKEQKPLVPKKTYLLARSETGTTTEKLPTITKDTVKEAVSETSAVANHKSAASAIDSLVKAAELLENQSNSKSQDSSSADSSNTPIKRGRGRPRKNPLPEGATAVTKTPSPQKKPRLSESKSKHDTDEDDEDDDDDSTDDAMIKENWTMGKINENIVCPICNKLFRSENVVFKHVKHCTGPSPSRSDSDKRSPRRLRRSYEYDLKNDEQSEATDTDSEKSIPLATARKRKSRDHTVKSVEKSEVIVIEDTPVKEQPKREDKKQLTKAASKTKPSYNTSNLVCEFCGKTFRQLSYLVSHKLQHKKIAPRALRKSLTEQNDNKVKIQNNKATSVTEQPKKSVFSCEVCKKEFRKLHHLVQHRIIHNSSLPPRALRKSSSEQSDNKVKAQTQTKQSEDQSAGFRCEPCDKSFRKLHHLVEHRETHREKDATSTQPAVDRPEIQYDCDICKKTFKKMEQLLEHKDQHLETSSEKSDDKSVQSSLSTRDIIHECSLCYMVFPNEHSLNRHTIICQRKKRQSASKLAKQTEESAEPVAESDSNVSKAQELDIKEVITETPKPPVIEKAAVEKQPEIEKPKEIKPLVKPVRKSKTPDIVEPEKVQKDIVPKVAAPELREEKKVAKPEATKVVTNTIQTTIKKPDSKPAPKANELKRKIPVKDRTPITATKRKKSVNMPLPAIQEKPKPVESSDDDEIRYMLNPDFKSDENVEGKQFMNIRANKRSSLQLERPNSKDLMKRRTSLQHPPKISRLKPKVSQPTVATVSKPVKLDAVPSTDSDDSDVKYSFPETTTQDAKKPPRKSMTQKRKSLNGIAKRKSLGKVQVAKTMEAPPVVRPIKRRTLDVEHRCDCGQLFSSAALLARHAVLSHTPPRIRRRRSPPPEQKTNKTTRKSNKTPAHKNVPVPDKVRKLIEKTKK